MGPVPRAWALLLLVVLVGSAVPSVSTQGLPTAELSRAPSGGSPLVAGSVPAGPTPLDAVLSIVVSASPTTAMPKALVTFTLSIQNSGTASSPKAWVNDTLPVPLVYVSDGASSAGATGAYPSFVFSNLSVGVHTFSLTARVPIGTAPGTVVTDIASLVYTTQGGPLVVAPSGQASVTIGLAWKQLHLRSILGLSTSLSPDAPTTPTETAVLLTPGGTPINFDLSPSFARDFRVVNLTAVLYLVPTSGNSVAEVLNLTVTDWNGAGGAIVASSRVQVTMAASLGYVPVTFFFPAVNHLFRSGNLTRLTVALLANSAVSANLATHSSRSDSQLDALTPTYVSVDRIDLTDAKGIAGPLSPKDSLVIKATISDPFGASEVADARLNVTAPSGGANIANASMGSPISSGGATATYQTMIPALLANGTYLVEVDGIETNGVVDAAINSTVVQAPGFAFTKTANVAQAKRGDAFTYTLFYNNTGTGPAGRVWVNDTLPAQLTFQSSTPNPNSVAGGTYGWAFTNVAVGPHRIDISVRVSSSVSGVAYIPNTATLAFSDAKGYMWPAKTSTAYVVTNGPVLSLSASSLPANWVHSNETVVDTITIVNTGDAANRLWVNATLPTGLAYLSDTAASLGGTKSTSGNRVLFNFTNMPSGTSTPIRWSFNMTVNASKGLSRGALLLTPIAANYSSTSDLLMPEKRASIGLTVAAPWVPSGILRFASAVVVPGVSLTLYANFTNAGNEAASFGWLNLTLDPNLTFIDATPIASSSAGNNVTLNLSNVAVGAIAVPVRMRADWGVMDRQSLSVAGTLDYKDGRGNRMPEIVFASGVTVIAVPDLRIAATPTSTSVEAGGSVTFTVTTSNTGSGIASVAWLNSTLPPGLRYVSDTLGGNLTVLGAGYNWTWANVLPGARRGGITFLANPAVSDRSSANLTFDYGGYDAGGNLQRDAQTTIQTLFVAPAIQLRLSADKDTSLAGGYVWYTVTLRNGGSTTAHVVWVNDTIDPRLQVITYESDVPARGTSDLNWTFTDMLPGQNETIRVYVRVADGVPAKSELAEAVQVTYTNSVGAVLGYPRASITTQVSADWTVLFYIVIGGGGAGVLAVFFVYRRYKVQIEDIFLIYRDGILISHLSRSIVQHKDEDQLSGMLTAVQDFVRDAFRYGEHRELHQLEFGDYRILIEQGKFVYLAVVYEGKDSALIRRKVRTALDSVEKFYGGILAKWDGDMETVAGSREILRTSLLRRFEARPRPPAP